MQPPLKSKKARVPHSVDVSKLKRDKARNALRDQAINPSDALYDRTNEVMIYSGSITSFAKSIGISRVYRQTPPMLPKVIFGHFLFL